MVDIPLQIRLHFRNVIWHKSFFLEQIPTSANGWENFPPMSLSIIISAPPSRPIAILELLAVIYAAVTYRAAPKLV